MKVRIDEQRRVDSSNSRLHSLACSRQTATIQHSSSSKLRTKCVDAPSLPIPSRSTSLSSFYRATLRTLTLNWRERRTKEEIWIWFRAAADILTFYAKLSLALRVRVCNDALILHRIPGTKWCMSHVHITKAKEHATLLLNRSVYDDVINLTSRRTWPTWTVNGNFQEIIG